MTDELLTVAEVAEILRLNQQTVRNWIDNGKLAHIRLGERRVRIKRSDLDRIINPSRSPRSRQPGGRPDWGSEILGRRACGLSPDAH